METSGQGLAGLGGLAQLLNIVISPLWTLIYQYLGKSPQLRDAQRYTNISYLVEPCAQVVLDGIKYIAFSVP